MGKCGLNPVLTALKVWWDVSQVSILGFVLFNKWITVYEFCMETEETGNTLKDSIKILGQIKTPIIWVKKMKYKYWEYKMGGSYLAAAYGVRPKRH